MHRPVLVPGVLLCTFCILFGAVAAPPKGNPPTPPPRGPDSKSLVAKIHKLHQELQKLQTEAATKLVHSRDKYHTEISKLHRSDEKWEAELAKVRHEEWSELKKAIDPAKARPIREKYAQQIAGLEKQHAPKAAEIAKSTQQKDAEVAKVHAKWKAEITKINPPENKLEAQLAQLHHQERQELHQLIDPAKRKEIQEKFNPQIEEQNQKVLTLEQKMSQANERLQEKVGKVEAELQEQLAQLDPPEDRLEDKLALLWAQRKAGLADAATPEARRAVVAEFDPAIKEMQQKKKALETSMEMARTVAKIKIQGLQSVHRTEIGILDPPEDKLEAQVHRMRMEERAAIAKLADPAKVKAIHASYEPRIADLVKKIHGQEGDKAQLTKKMQAETAKVVAAWQVQMAKIDPPADRLVHKLHILHEKEQAELRSVLDPAKVSAIQAKYHSRIQDLTRKIQTRNEQIALLGTKHQQEMKTITDGFHAKAGPLEKQIGQALAQLALAKR